MKRLEVTAFHEAGHAIAVQLRGGTVTALTIDPGLTEYELPRKRVRFFINGVRTDEPLPQPPTEADGFVAYAGPWAETRCRWPLPTLDGLDDYGVSFDQYLRVALRQNTGDFETYNSATKSSDTERLWSQELEDAWPQTLALAQRLQVAHRARVGRSRKSVNRRARR